jgi:iron transport multicopper oxidase
MRQVAGLFGIVVLWCSLSASAALGAGITNSGNDLRDGWYGDQRKLSPDLVGGSTFGKLWTGDVDGQVYAQPLVHDQQVIVATERNQVSSFDAETGAKSWSLTLEHGTPWNPKDIGCSDLLPDIGVTGTPVIDETTNTIYLTHKTYASGTTGPAVWWMDALDADTGAERPGFPVEITGKAQNAPGLTFNPTVELQRPGLLLLDGVVYAAFGGHCDHGNYQGWIFGISTTGTIKARWAAANWGAGIWQSGSGLMSDGPGRIYASTGNGGSPTPPRSTPGTSFGESVVRLAVQADGSLKAMDFFAPYDAATLDTYDADFASGGVTSLRDSVFGTPQFPHVGIAVGKAGYVYLLNRDDLGGIGTGTGGGDRVLSRVGPNGGVWSRPGVWPGDGGWIVIPTASGAGGDTPASGGSTGFLKTYRYRKGALGVPSLDAPVQSDDAFGFSSSAPVITSDGMASGSALVWIIWTPTGSGIGAQLRAYDAVPVNGHLRLRRSWPIGRSAKFTMPGVGNGRIYVGTRDGKVHGFGAPVKADVQAPATTFPVTTVDTTAHADVPLTIGSDLTITSITASPSIFTPGTSGLGLPRTLVEGDTLNVPVAFTPTVPGTAGGALTIETDKGSFSFGLMGTGEARAALLTATPPTISFGGTVVGQERAGTITFGNGGGQPLTIEELTAPDAPFTLEQAPAVGDQIAPGEAINVTVRYKPTAVGPAGDELTLRTTGGEETIGLSGTAGLGPHLVVAPGAGWDFGDVRVGESKTVAVTLSNTGDSPMSFTKSKFPTDPAFTVLDELPEGTTIAPGDSVTLRVRFDPTVPGAVTDQWTLNAGDGTGVHEVPLSATALLGPHLEVAPGAGWGFGDVPVGTSETMAVVLSNTGDSPMTFATSQAPTHPAFTVVDRLAQGTTVPAGETRTVRVRFAPTAAGAVTDRWTLDAGDGTGVHEVPVTGAGTVTQPDPEPGPEPQPQPQQDTGSAVPLEPAPLVQSPALTPVAPGSPVSAQGTVFPAKVLPDFKVVRAVVARDGKRLTIVGLSNPLASGSLGLTVTARTTARRTSTVVTGRRVLGGRFVVHVTLPRAARRWRSLKVTARFAGNSRVWPGAATLVLVPAR